MPNKFSIEVRDDLYERVGLIEQYSSFEAVVKYCDVGTWTLSIDASLSEASLISEGCGIVVWTPGLAEPLLSGPVKSITREWNTSNPASLVTFTGVTDEQWLHERIIFPNPDLAVNAQDRDRETGAISAAGALSYFAHKNIGADSRTERVHPYLTVDDADYGPIINVSARFDVLGEYLKQIAQTGNVGFRVFQEGTGIRMKIFTPENRSQDVIFSPDLGNISDYKYTVSAPEATWVAVAAQGDGKFRWIKEFGSAVTSTEYVNSNDPRVVFDPGLWDFHFNTTGGDYLKDYHNTTTNGATATLSFTGTGVAVYLPKGSAQGTVEIYVDDILKSTVNLYNGSFGPYVPQQKIYEVLDLEYAAHTVTVKKVAGTSTTGPEVRVDYFVVTTRPFETGGQEWKSLNAEKFADRRDIPVSKSTAGTPVNPDDQTPVFPDVLAQLDQAGIEVMYESAAKAQLSVTPIDTEQLQFGRDYQLGDIVAVSIDGVTLTDVLREVRLADNLQGGPVVSPIVGTPDASESPVIYKTIKKLRQALKKLEARQ